MRSPFPWIGYDVISDRIHVIVVPNYGFVIIALPNVSDSLLGHHPFCCVRFEDADNCMKRPLDCASEPSWHHLGGGLGSNDNDPVHVVWHDNKLIERNIREMVRDLTPTVAHKPARA